MKYFTVYVMSVLISSVLESQNFQICPVQPDASWSLDAAMKHAYPGKLIWKEIWKLQKTKLLLI